MKISVLDLEFLGEQKAIAAFLVEHRGERVLIETGPHSTLQILEKRLAENGLKLTDIDHVFLSHIHLDHAGAAWFFAQNGATIYVHPAGRRHLSDPSKLMASAKMIYGDDMDRLWGQMNIIMPERLVCPENGQKFRVGNIELTAWHTPGHAIHHIAWQIENVLFTGDVAGVKIGSGPVLPPCPPPDIQVEDWLSSIELMRKLDVSRLFLTHFGEIGDKTGHLDELENRLREWANWMKPYFEKGAPQAEIIPQFEIFFKNSLLEKGVSPADLKKYEAANPPFMSVAGLMRYWNKRPG